MSNGVLYRSLTVLSFGAGQDSTALLYKYINDPEFRLKYAPEDFLVIMSDTGDEHPETYKHVERIKILCQKHQIEFVLVTEDLGFHGSWGTLRKFYKKNNTIGSKAFPKSCTDKLKIVPIYKYLGKWLSQRYGVRDHEKDAFKQYAAKYGKIKIMLGIAYGEEKRVAGSADDDAWMRKSIEKIYPLIDLKMDRKACQTYIASVGETVPPPSNCMLCPFMSEIELLWLYRNYPNDYHEWVTLEANKIRANEHMGDRNLGVWGQKLLPEKLKEATAKYGKMTTKELNDYKMSHGHCVKSKY